VILEADDHTRAKARICSWQCINQK